ncbi:hypothetical protein NIES2109_40300 [Nostoc sp. HK-01]|uniref:Uncharacterized protein n=2 Tax=Nostocales TaxID=1161 RepID=A0A1Z4GBA9_9CYAN|nr:hypothetical protein [Nostoc cycadae]BAY14800.1 hypothetical protein NIES21_05840 [Anabaenopsis circularis NIES-21]BBD61203.1 hypothetical protein NIES2109_40300 [Nostoc sp. HK-01]GBE91747.1 hypothetical protein NCWK1_1474 [Nostoc cycadae WK-1]
MANKLYLVAIAALNKHSKRYELTVCTAEVEPDKEDKLEDKVNNMALTIYPLNKYSQRQIQTQLVDQETISRCI